MAKLSIKSRYNQSDVFGWIKQAEDDWSWAKASFRTREYKFALTPKFTPADLKKLHTHDLFSLVKQVEVRSRKCPLIIRQACEELNNYYMASRYPDVHEAVGEYTRELAKKALTLAMAVFKFVKNQVIS